MEVVLGILAIYAVAYVVYSIFLAFEERKSYREMLSKKEIELENITSESNNTKLAYNIAYNALEKKIIALEKNNDELKQGYDDLVIKHKEEIEHYEQAKKEQETQIADLNQEITDLKKKEIYLHYNPTPSEPDLFINSEYDKSDYVESAVNIDKDWEIHEQSIKKNPQSKASKYREKGKAYEIQIGKKYEELGYIVSYNGIEKGKLDEGIDLIAISDKKKEIILIQCKNQKSTKNSSTIEKFALSADNFIKKKYNNAKYKDYKKLKYFYSTSAYANSAFYPIKENNVIYKVEKFRNFLEILA